MGPFNEEGLERRRRSIEWTIIGMPKLFRAGVTSSRGHAPPEIFRPGLQDKKSGFKGRMRVSNNQASASMYGEEGHAALEWLVKSSIAHVGLTTDGASHTLQPTRGPSGNTLSGFFSNRWY